MLKRTNQYLTACGMRIITIALAPLMIPIPVVAQSIFYDIQGNWAQGCINRLAEQGIINGYPDGSFRPDLYINRAEFAAIVGKAFPQAVQTRNAVEFKDVPGYYWAHEQIKQAYQTGFISGYPRKLFKPSQKISRTQVLVALTSGLNYSPTMQATTTLNYFADANTIPAYARTKIATATENRLVVNYPNVRYFNPNKKATRAEVAAFLCQAMVNYNQAAVIPQQYIVNISNPQTIQTISDRYR